MIRLDFVDGTITEPAGIIPPIIFWFLMKSHFIITFSFDIILIDSRSNDYDQLDRKNQIMLCNPKTMVSVPRPTSPPTR